MKTALLQITLFAFFAFISICGFSQITVNTLQELKEYLDDDNVNIKLAPGQYYVTGEDCENGLFGDDVKIGNSAKVMLLFTGNNSTYDFTDVTINFETSIFQTFGGSYDIAEIQILGNNNVLKNLTMVDDGSVHDKPDKGGNAVVMDGEANRIEGFHISTKGSFPYGYGDVFGKGGSYTIKHYKHCGVLVRGQSNHFKNSTIIHRCYGHALYMQAAFDPIIEGCYIEGEMRSTDDMLLEEGTGSPADLIDFQTDFGFRLLPGWMKALGEEGIRCYNGGTTLVNGDTLTGAAENPTILNCVVKNMRGGITLAHANGTAYVEGCTVIGCQGGYSIRTGSVVDCYADCAYGQVLKYAYNSYKNTDIDITIIPPEDAYYHNGPKCVAYIGGSNHNIVLKNTDPNPNPNLNIQFGGHIDFLSFQEGNSESSQNNHTPSGVTLENYSGYNIVVAEGSDNNNITTCATWEDNGAGNTFNTFDDCSISPVCQTVRDPFDKIEAESFCETEGTGIAGGNTCIGSIYNGDWVKYNKAVFGTDYADGIALVVGKNHSDITYIDIYLDDLTSEKIASVEVPFTGGWYDWETVTVDIPEINGVHDIYLAFRNDNSESAVANVESFSFLQNNLCGLTNHHGLTPIDAEDFCEMFGVETVEIVAGNNAVSAINDGDYIAYGNVNFDEETVNSIIVSAATANDGGTIEIRKDSPTGELITSLTITNTGGWDSYKNFTPEMPFVMTGNHNLYFVFVGNDDFLFNIDKFTFEYNLCKETSFDGFSTIQAEDYCKMYGIGTETVSGSNLAVNAIQANDYVVFGNVDFGSGIASKLSVRTASQTSGGTLEVRSGSIYGELITTVQIAGTGNWKTYQEFESTEAFTITGKHDLYFVFDVESGYICNLDEFTFSGEPCQTSAHDGFVTIEAEEYCEMMGVELQDGTDDDATQQVSHIQNGDYIRFGIIDFGEESAGSVTARVSSQTSGGTIELRSGSTTGDLIAEIPVTGTGNWTTWESVSTDIETSLTGKQDIYLVFTGGDGYLFNLNWIEFTKETIDDPVTGTYKYIELKSTITDVQPMTGIVLWSTSGSRNSDAIQLEYNYMLYNDIVEEKGVYDWSAVENLLDDIASRGHQAVLRFRYIYPGYETSVPDYIKAMDDYNEIKGTSEGNTTYFCDWSNQELKDFSIEFYQKFAEKYDNDPRLAFVQTGFGLWSEYHIYDPGEELGVNFPDKDFQELFLENMNASFIETPWSLSIDASNSWGPFTSNESLKDLNFGLFDDSFMHEKHDDYNKTCWNFFGSDRYLREPAGGEFSYFSDYDQQNVLNEGTGAYGIPYEDFATQYGITYIIGNDQPEYHSLDRIKEASMASGYKFQITEFMASESASLVTVKNIGIAPIYYDAYPTVNGVRSETSLKLLAPGESIVCSIASGGTDPQLTIESDRLVEGQEIQYEADLEAGAVETTTQTITLKQGWNLVSLYIEPDECRDTRPCVSTVFPNATIVKTFDTFYSTSHPDFLNTLTNIEAGKGYLVYNEIEETIEVSGVETHGRASLQDGWNLIGVSSSTPLPVSTYPDAQIIKDFDSLYKKDDDLSSLTELEPGKAYYMR